MGITIATWTVTAILVFFAIAQITIGGYIGALVLAAAAVLISPPGTARIVPGLSGNTKARMLMGWAGIGLLLVVALAGPKGPAPAEESKLTTQEELASVADERGTHEGSEPAASMAAPEPATSFATDFPERTREQAKALWTELKAARYDPQFHQFGYARGGPFGDWETRRKALDNEWVEYVRTVPRAGYKDAVLGSAIHWMYSVGQDWYRTAGEGDDDTAALAGVIDFELSR